MKLSNLGGPFEEATAAAVAATPLDRIQGTQLAETAVTLDGTLPPQARPWWHKLFGPAGFTLLAVGFVGYLTWKDRARTPGTVDLRQRDEHFKALNRAARQSRRLRSST
jgi:hypothetical protein